MIPTSEDIFSIAQNVLDTMVKVEAFVQQDRRLDDIENHVTGCIQISGTWQGAVVLQTTDGFARNAASRMLCIENIDLTRDDIQDAMAELTNMIGGNIKSQVPGPSYLSLPTVTTGANSAFPLAKTHRLNDVTIEVDNEPLRIILCDIESPTP
jgi:chemotaxis protein CheX